VSTVNESDMKEESSGANDAGDGGGVIVIKSIEDADTSAVSPFIVSLPSEEGLGFSHALVSLSLSLA